MSLIDCIVKTGLISDEEISDLKNRVKTYMDKLGYDEMTAEARVKHEFINDQHIKLNGELNEIKEQARVGKQKVKVSAFPNVTDINKNYKSELENIQSQSKTNENAIQQSQTGTVLQREQDETGSTGSERGRVEQSQQGNEPPIEGKEGENTGEESPETTSIKNEVVNERRKQQGFAEADKVMRKTFGETWEEAKKKLDEGYNTQDLIDELKKKPRSISDVEDALLLHEQNIKEIELINANKKINEAADSGDQQALNEWQVRRSKIKDELYDIYNVGKKAGTETARGLSARQMIADRKYNLVNMESEKRAANGGAKLTVEQETDIQKLHQKIKDTQDVYEQYKKEAEEEIKKLQEKILGKGIKDKKSAAQKLREAADKVEKSRFGKADLGEGTQIAGASFDLNKAVANSMRLIADGLDKGKELLDLVKEAIEKIKSEFPDADENLLRRSLNKQVIESGIVGTYKKEVTDYSRLLKDPKLIKLEADAQRAKNEFDISLEKDKLSKRPKFQKVLGGFVKFERAAKLSNPATLGKLGAAGLSRLTTTPLEDVVGSIISPFLPKSLKKGAIGEGGGVNIKETVSAYKEGIMKGIQDSKDILSKKSHGKSDIDVLFGNKGNLPPEALDFFGQLHSAIKAPIKRFAFERGLQRRLTNYVKNGVDITDPMVQTEVILGAYKDANRAIFMQDNKIADGWQKMVNYFESTDPKTGKSRSAATAATMQWLLPFVKVPTNIAAETGTHVYGVPVGIGKMVYSMFDGGLKNLSADEKDIILRNLKKGSLGLAAMALGYMKPQTFGGYYQQYEHRKEGDAKANAIKILGVNIPSWLLESPLLQAMQIGATVRRVKDGLTDGNPKGIGEGMFAAGLGMIDKVPMVDQPQRIFGALNNAKERSYYVGELAKSTVVPSVVQKTAEMTDTEKKRYPSTVLEHVESGIPGLRENVPSSKPSKGKGLPHLQKQKLKLKL